MTVSKSRRPVVSPNLITFTMGDDGSKKGTKLETHTATAGNRSFSGIAQPMVDTLKINPDSEKEVVILLRTNRIDVGDYEVNRMKELWHSVSSGTKAEIECKLFELAVDSGTGTMTERKKQNYDAVRILAARTLIELPIVDKKDQMARLSSTISRQVGKGIRDPTCVTILEITDIAVYGKRFTFSE